MDRYELGERLKLLRKAAGKTQDDLARSLNVTRASISLWEGGEREPRATVFLALLQELGVPFDMTTPIKKG